ncbi:MAG: hypothetical protein ACYTEU_06155 [Planctomycetota bacterium]
MAKKKRKYRLNPKKHVQASKTQCPKGHDYDPFNTYEYTNKRGVTRRYCKICRTLRQRKLSVRAAV